MPAKAQARTNRKRPPNGAQRVRANPESWRLEQFVDAYRQTFDATKAAIAAGYAPSGARAQACHLLAQDKTQALLAKRALDTVAQTNVRVSDILTALMEIAYLDPAECFQDVSLGQKVRVELKDLQAMPKHVRRCISSFKLSKIPVAAGGFMDVIEVKFWSKTEALNMLGKHKGLLNDVLEVQVTAKHLEKLSDDDLVRTQREALEKLERHVEARARLRLAADNTPSVQPVANRIIVKDRIGKALS